ncbi:MAG: SDR family NAD(P)-dependent oxidoreductase [Spartobacteria bacterium]|nr:SDR family NAD(P)-dependent oxidoreductase [Spartobacteria bacterium]
MKAATVRTKSVMVTGCSSGIGYATAKALREAGWRVAPTARKEEDLERLTAEGFSAIPLDVADGASVERAFQQCLEIMDGTVGALVNNAGFGQPGAMEDLTRKALEYQFAVNVIGLQDLTNRFVPVFRAQGYGRIVQVSSVLGRLCLPFMGAYSATKFAVEAMADSMRVELAGSGVAVSLIEPGPIRTGFGANAVASARRELDLNKAQFRQGYSQHLPKEWKENYQDRFTRDPEVVAKKILHAVTSPSPKARYPVTVVAYFGAFMARFAPARLIDHVMYKRQFQRYG